MSKIPQTVVAILMICSCCRAENAREEYDFNFDGRPDYRVKTLENGKADQYDVFIFNPETKNFAKDLALSGTINPRPDEKHKQVRCSWPGGHSGAIYGGTVYDWDGKVFKLAYSVRQTALTIDGKIVYIRVKVNLENGIPEVQSIERIKPDWED